MSMLKAVKSAQFIPSTADFYLNRFTKERHKQLKQVSFLLLRRSRQDAPRTSISRSVQKSKNAQSDFSRNLHTQAASRSLPQVVPQPLMSSNRQSNSQGIQRHQNHRKQRLESTEI
ncbi:hypothetical protein F511_46601 [Dorcoceras hygrometricum]|uniref:Uncharacterized protein n=1 Tax=Dorcoceras hygrometricum TaxID=472368 RepID=A0A2Z6ZT46_9LAMI|nr:hypothetical protein F511_46601 [Dorcoceras hygrometricum]